MNASIITLWTRVRDSYWFVPSLLVVGSILLSFATTALDESLGSDWIDDIDWLSTNQPEGARAVLSTVAGSMITVAGVTFSMTILSISHTTSQIGPRLLNNFMADKANQFTLGVFISTFIYCLMVLRTVRSAESAPPGSDPAGDLAGAFVPQIAVVVGVLMAIASVGVLIFFIHHVPETIHVSNIISDVGKGLNRHIDDQFPARVGEPGDTEGDDATDAEMPAGFYSTACRVDSTVVGYLEYIDGDGLMKLAVQHDLVLKIQRSPGDFVTPSSSLLLASPQDRIDDSVSKALASRFICGVQRTATQDLRFQVNQLVEVAMRALSPGVNDPFTAISCIDWLQAALENLAARELPESHRYDEDQTLRLVATPVTFAAFASLVFDQLRPYVAADRNAALRLMAMLGDLVVQPMSARDQRLLARHGCALQRECRKAQTDLRSLGAIHKCYRELLRRSHDPARRAELHRRGAAT
ncbi:hypothetical protein Poly24_02340 [Rosistilla carotiformis]|uniref:DUF2254 domain-containing protein n=1 Tax=Rosistilla carotiformis TaxID=2528017 RepID=A0A518JM31_9BACT|nr:DUF2254 domain-containing protein [Rosistilla carotiformis]QDV66547.1 hypothetical protein Poly24_02340 [Rosistilla carotiformis]